MKILSILREKDVSTNTHEKTAFFLSGCVSHVMLANSVTFYIFLTNFTNPGQTQNQKTNKNNNETQ